MSLEKMKRDPGVVSINKLIGGEFKEDLCESGKFESFTALSQAMNSGAISDTPEQSKILAKVYPRKDWAFGFPEKKTKYGWIIKIEFYCFIHADIVNSNSEDGVIEVAWRNPELGNLYRRYNQSEIPAIYKVIKRSF